MAKKTADASPPLAHYKDISDYVPRFGDYIIWSGWFVTWHGIVSDFDDRTGDLITIFSGNPYVLLTLTPEEQKRETSRVHLSKVQGASHGTFAILQHDAERNVNIWFI